MSDAPKEESGKKKGGKLPIILAVVLMVGGGGFFMTKKNGKHEKPKIKEAKEEILLPDEYINNMADGRTYVRVKLGLKTVDGFKAEEVMSHDAEISDAINTILKTTDPKEIVTEKQVKTLKIRICAALNTILENADPEKSKKDESDKEADSEEKDSKTKKEKGDEADNSDSGDTKETAKKPKLPTVEDLPEGWDSKKGPILKVFFKALATQ